MPEPLRIEADAVVVTKPHVDAIAKAEQKHPSMSEIRSIPGYRESSDGSWSAPFAGAWGEAMQPFWRADMYRHQNNLGSGAYEPRSRFSGRTTMIADASGRLWKLDGDEWVEA